MNVLNSAFSNSIAQIGLGMMTRIMGALAVVALAVGSAGCDNTTTAVEGSTVIVADNSDPIVETEGSELGSATDANNQENTSATSPQESTEQEPGVLKKAGDLLGKAASSGGAAKDWVQDKLSGAADASGQAADDSMKWATDTFNSLKEKGLTTASDTSEWLSEDWKNSQSWQYKVVNLTGENDAMTKELNKLGNDGWECFHSVGDRFFFKKPADSYLRDLPFKDFIKIVPLLHKATQ